MRSRGTWRFASTTSWFPSGACIATSGWAETSWSRRSPTRTTEKRLGDELRAAHDVLYLASIQTTSVFDGARGLIEDLRGAGAAVILASSAKEREVDHYLDLLDARELVDGWTTSADVEQTKPEPDLVLAALAKLDDDAEAVMVGDTPWDVEAARRAGVPTVAVLTGGFSAAGTRGVGRRGRFRVDRVAA